MVWARRREADHCRMRRRAEVRRSSRSRAWVSTLSADSGWFSSEGDEENDEKEGVDYFDEEDDYETETLVSSTDYLSDNVLRREGMRRRRRREVVKRCPSSEGVATAVLRRLVPCGSAVAEGKVRESFTVVKQSKDP